MTLESQRPPPRAISNPVQTRSLPFHPFLTHHPFSHLLPNLELQLADSPPSPFNLFLKQRSRVLAVDLITSLLREEKPGGGESMVMGQSGNKTSWRLAGLKGPGSLQNTPFVRKPEASILAALPLPVGATWLAKLGVQRGEGWGGDGATGI